MLFLTDVKAIGLETAQGLNFTETFYWDMNDQTRVLKKFFGADEEQRAADHGAGWHLLRDFCHYFKALDGLGADPHMTASRSSKR